MQQITSLGGSVSLLTLVLEHGGGTLEEILECGEDGLCQLAGHNSFRDALYPKVVGASPVI